jgi:hypothetical protein
MPFTAKTIFPAADLFRNIFLTFDSGPLYILKMRRFAAAFAIVLAIFPETLPAQRHAADPSQAFHRLICLVHLKGSGTLTDPRRPEYVPDPGAEPSRGGIIAWAFQLSDDGTMAIVHYVAVDRNAFQAILADRRPEVRVFEIGVATRAQIEAAMSKYKAGFSLDSLRVMAR